MDGCGESTDGNGWSLLFSVFRIRSMESASERRSVAPGARWKTNLGLPVFKQLEYETCNKDPSSEPETS